MAVRARASQLMVVVVHGGVLVRSCLAKGVLATSGDLRTYFLKTKRRNREICPPEFHDDVAQDRVREVWLWSGEKCGCVRAVAHGRR